MSEINPYEGESMPNAQELQAELDKLARKYIYIKQLLAIAYANEKKQN